MVRFTARVEPDRILPAGASLHVDVADVAGLTATLGAELKLAGLAFLAYDDDFEEWCGLSDLHDVAEGGTLRVMLTEGTPVQYTPLPAAAAAAPPQPQPAPQPSPQRAASQPALGRPPTGPGPVRAASMFSVEDPGLAEELLEKRRAEHAAAEKRLREEETQARELERQHRELTEECEMYKEHLALLSRDKDIVEPQNYAAAEKALAAEEAELKRQHDEVAEEKRFFEASFATLQAESAELDRQEQEHWNEFNAFAMQRDGVAGSRDAILAVCRRLERQNEMLTSTNVFNEAFYVWHDESDSRFGTINGFRLGSLPDVRVEWPEINSAWGEAALLLQTMVRLERFEFLGAKRIEPMGSYSQMVVDEKRLNLYGARMSPSFDRAMDVFLQCVQEFGQYAESCDPSFRLPYHIEGDKICPPNHPDKSVSIKRGKVMRDDTQWTHALKYLLTDLKFLQTWSYNRGQRRR